MSLRRLQLNAFMLLTRLHEVTVVNALLLVVEDLTRGKTNEKELFWLEGVAVGRKLDVLLGFIRLRHRHVLVLEVTMVNEFHLTATLFNQ